MEDVGTDTTPNERTETGKYLLPKSVEVRSASLSPKAHVFDSRKKGLGMIAGPMGILLRSVNEILNLEDELSSSTEYRVDVVSLGHF